MEHFKDTEKHLVTQKQKNTFILTVTLLICSVLLVFLFYLMSGQGSRVIIEVSGKAVKVLPIKKDIIYSIYTDANGENILEINSGKAYIKSANCNNQVCVHSKSISNEGESIICLPHKVHIYIK